MSQIELHKKIDFLLSKNPADVKKEEISTLVSANFDARQYFFAKADEKWLSWLWDNGFLDVIKKKAEDPNSCKYGTPELNYLVKVSEKAPKKVTDIILAVPVSSNTFNPEVIDRFLQICGKLPADQLARIVPKILEDEWVSLMGLFNRWGFEHEKMFKTLTEAKDYKTILVLAEAILAIRPKEEMKQHLSGYIGDSPFYLKDLSHTKVFEYLANVDNEYLEETFKLTTLIMSRIVLLGDETKEKNIFSINDIYYLFDVDFFSLQLGQQDRLSYKEDIHDLAATIVILANRLIGDKCDQAEFVMEIYKKYIKTLPDSRAMWRLKLFVLSLCPKVFKAELKQVFFKLFNDYPYYDIISGAEYEKTLHVGFSVLSETDKRDYVKRVFEYFSQEVRDIKEKEWNKRHGWEILSSICDQLTKEEQEKCEQLFGKRCDSSYEPEPSIGKSKGGWIKPKAPLTLEELNKFSITEIVTKLKNEWSPEKLSSQNTGDDFLNPLNAEGMDELMRADIAQRINGYITNATIFFERDVLDQHYTYSFFRGLQEAVRNNKANLSDINWDELITVCLNIKKSAEEKPFEQDSKKRREVFDSWLSDWTGVHSAITDVLQELLDEKSGSTIIDFSKYRDQLFEIISYLLTNPDPRPEEEKLESASMTTKAPGDEQSYISDPFTMAINSVRGRVFQSFILFVYQDSKKFKKEEKIKISADVKSLYESILKNEKTRTLMFMFGHYLASFYFRDIDWIQKLFPQIFPTEPEKKNLFSASWEGYLSNNLYQEIFSDLNIQELYKKALTVETSEEDTKQKYFKDPDEGIAEHLALAFMYYEEFNFEHPLFKAFWESDLKRRRAFISFIGRLFISGDNARANELLEKEPRSKQRIKELWDWVIENYTDPELFTEFGFWINLEKNIFNIPWLAKRVKKTLEKANGFLEWDYGLTKSIITIAQQAPQDTLAITRLYFWDGGIKGSQRRRPYYIDNEWLEAFKILYNNPETKDGTYILIDDLIREGGNTFWGLKEVLKTQQS